MTKQKEAEGAEMKFDEKFQRESRGFWGTLWHDQGKLIDQGDGFYGGEKGNAPGTRRLRPEPEI